MPSLGEIVDGFKKTFSMSDIRKPKPRVSVCRECEIIGSAASFTATAYVWHQTRMGKLMPIPGMFISSTDDEILKLWKKIEEEKRLQKSNITNENDKS